MGRVGHEHPPLPVSKTPISAEGGAKSDAHNAPNTLCDPDLARLVKAWPSLPKHIKTEINRLIEKHSVEGKDND